MSQLKKKYLLANAVDETKILLNNNANVRARNAADSADVNILKLNASDRIEFASVPQVTSSPLVANDLVRKAYVDAQVAALGTQSEWQTSVLGQLATPPVSPTLGDRYLVIATATGDFAGKETQIAQYNGATWDFTVPTTGTFVSDDSDSSSLLYFGGVSWTTKSFEATTASTGLTKVGFDIRLDSSAAGSGLGFSSGVLSVNVDGSTIEINADTLRVKSAGILPVHIDRTDTGLNADSLSLKTGYASSAGTVAATDTIQQAIAKLDGNTAAHISDSSDAHDASAISYVNTTSGLAATEVQSAIDEIDADLDTAESTLSSHVGASSAVHGITGSVVGTSDSQTLTNKTIDASSNTVSNIATSMLAASAFDIDGTLAANSDTKLPSQKAVKTYVDTKVGAVPIPRENSVTIDATILSNKYFDLTHAVAQVDSVLFMPVGGIVQHKVTDISISQTGGAGGVTRISWSGLGFDDLDELNDVILVRFEA